MSWGMKCIHIIATSPCPLILGCSLKYLNIFVVYLYKLKQISLYNMMILYQMWGMALGNESHKFDLLDNSINVVAIQDLLRFPIDIFFIIILLYF